MFPFKELVILQLLPVKKQLVPVGVDCALTFDLEVRQRVEQRVLGHQLLVDGVLETHGAGVGARHCKIRLHGGINEQGVCWKTHKAVWALGRQHLWFCSLLMQLTPWTITAETMRGEWNCTTAKRLISQFVETNGKQQRTGALMSFHLTSQWFREISEINLKHCHWIPLWIYGAFISLSITYGVGVNITLFWAGMDAPTSRTLHMNHNSRRRELL